MNWKLKLAVSRDYLISTIPNTINLSAASTPKTFDITDNNGNVRNSNIDTVNGGGRYILSLPIKPIITITTKAQRWF